MLSPNEAKPAGLSRSLVAGAGVLVADAASAHGGDRVRQ